MKGKKVLKLRAQAKVLLIELINCSILIQIFVFRNTLSSSKALVSLRESRANITLLTMLFQRKVLPLLEILLNLDKILPLALY